MFNCDTSNSQIQEGKQKLQSRDKIGLVVNVLINSICWMWISCDSQEHHWISTTTTPMWDQLGRPRIQKQPATVTTYQDEPLNHNIKSCRCRGPIVSSPHLGMVDRFCVSFPSSRGSRVDGTWRVIQDDTRYLGVVWCVWSASMIFRLDHPTFREDDDLRLLWKICLHLFLKRAP